MIVPQLYLNEGCCEAIEIYEKAFHTKLDSIVYDPEKEPNKFVIHAEMHIHGQRVMLSDWGGNKDLSIDSALQIVVIFDNENELKEAYEIMKTGSQTIIPMAPTFYSTCLVDFLDKFGVRWCFMI